MKRLVAFAALMLAGLLFLAACTTPPITIPLSDVSIDLSIAADSAGKVIFPENPLEFKNSVPATSVASVTIRGKAQLAQAASVSFDIYATDTDPGELGCAHPLLGKFYLCNPDDLKGRIQKVGDIAFEGNAGPVPFELRGTMLAKGINAESLYLGASIEGGTAGNVLYLEKMLAIVQLNIGK